MRRLTLILSDLYLQEDAFPVGGPQVPELPAFEWLLRTADQSLQITDWRSWLRAQMHRQTSDVPLAAFCAVGFVPREQLDSTWFASPVHLEVRIDHVRLADHGLLRLDVAERAAVCAEFSRSIGAPYALHNGGERMFYLTGVTAPAAHTIDPAHLLGSDIGAALPQGNASELRRLGAEIEMWLHGAAFNAQRERAGKSRISTLWIWRAAAPQPRDPSKQTRIDAMLYGGDPLIGALARCENQRACDAPAAFAQLAPGSSQVVVEFATLTGGPHEKLLALEENWFAPAKAALRGGALREIELVANDRIFRITSWARWRIWRRRAPWLAILRA